MSGRGRGGRGGRGGVSKTLNREQLNSLGVTSNDLIPGLVTQPPPIYPFIGKHPVSLQPSLEHDYLLILKQDFLDQLHLSPSYLRMPENKANQLEQEIDKLVAQLPKVKESYDWNLFPSELRPKMLAKRTKKSIRSDNVNVVEKLTKLEKIEEKSNGADAVKVKIEDDDDVDEVIIEEDEQEDEEMDDGTDYANNYFDNGEDYEEEDDNLDDGPIY